MRENFSRANGCLSGSLSSENRTKVESKKNVKQSHVIRINEDP